VGKRIERNGVVLVLNRNKDRLVVNHYQRLRISLPTTCKERVSFVQDQFFFFWTRLQGKRIAYTALSGSWKPWCYTHTRIIPCEFCSLQDQMDENYYYVRESWMEKEERILLPSYVPLSLSLSLYVCVCVCCNKKWDQDEMKLKWNICSRLRQWYVSLSGVASFHPRTHV